MSKQNYLKEFSKLSREGQLNMLSEIAPDQDAYKNELQNYRFSDDDLQSKFEQISENTISNFHLPYSIAPNFLIDENVYHVPMVTEESLVVEAAAKAANFWFEHGGFKTEEIATAKRGYIHIMWNGTTEELDSLFNQFQSSLEEKITDIVNKLDAHKVSLNESWLSDMTSEMENYYMLGFSLETGNSMEGNLINSLLDYLAKEFKDIAEKENPGNLEIIMAVLSNYTPGSYIKMKVESSVKELGEYDKSVDGHEFAEKFKKAVEIAKHSVSRAVTNNKGIMNGIDAVLMATGNDFRAAEAGAHAYSVTKGRHISLTDCQITDESFTFWIKIPLSLGTIGEITKLHPLVPKSLDILGQPDAKELMKIVAAVGLASNFSAIASLITQH
ncbi:MAG: hydroxymethylglutaryl-CoA reductase [Bacteroidota bacterium]